uniref:Uncharacterized protein n=1 Tax=viral metagenome TaxID=1070528 RepID=A0A6M3LYH2_9ZZZZ
MDIAPQTRKVYWNKDLEALWEPRIKRVRKLYSDAELATVVTGMRRVYVYHVNSERFDQSYDFLRRNDLVFFPTNKSAVYSGFSHRHLPVKRGTPYTLYGAAVKHDDQEAGELFTKYSTGDLTDHTGIGELLGYPTCCTEFFNETWSHKSIDPIYEAAIETPDAREIDNVIEVSCHPYCNNMLRYFGIRITPHLTCSMQCEETIKWGEEWIEIMRQIDDEATDWVIELLSMPLTWDCYKGVAIIDTPLFRGVTNSDMTMEKKMVRNLEWKQEEHAS